MNKKTITNWLMGAKIMSLPRRIIKKIILFAISGKNGVIVYYDDPERAKFLKLIKSARKDSQVIALLDNEAYQIIMAVKRTEKIEGDIAEVGVYKGGSAKLICEVKGYRALHLFDTFEGLPDVGEIDVLFHKGQFEASLEEIKNHLKKYSNVYFYKGFFPATADPVKNKKFSFIHLDVDIYSSTLDCLNFFYPKMSRGGVIVSHDYIYAAGVKKAFDDFFKDKLEPIIELSGSQCLIVKV